MAKIPHRIVWHRLDRQVDASKKKPIEAKQLQIRNFTAHEDNGIYSCALYSALPDDNTLIDETQIELNLPPSLTSSHVSATSSLARSNFGVHIVVHDRYSIDYGSNIKMECTVLATTTTSNHSVTAAAAIVSPDSSSYSLEWIRLNDKMPNNTLVVDNSLTLHNLTDEMLGEYVCLVTNKAGRITYIISHFI